jgi:hypothetical protein
MKTRRTLLLATIAAGGLFVAFASGAVPLSASPFRTVDGGRLEARTMLVDDHERDDEERSAKHDRDHGHGGGEHHAARDHNGDGGERRGAGNGPAGAGSATPPDNGLILKGTTPKVQVN